MIDIMLISGEMMLTLMRERASMIYYRQALAA